MKPLLALDWDGTLHGKKEKGRWVSAWPENGEWIPGALEALTELTEHYRITIYTSRIAPVEHYDWTVVRSAAAVRAEVEYIRERLDKAGFRNIMIHTEPFKPGAAYYVDDHAVHFNGRENAWRAIATRLLAAVGAEEIFPASLYPTEVR